MRKEINKEDGTSFETVLNMNGDSVDYTEGEDQMHECISVTTSNGHGAYCERCGETLA